MMLFNVIKAILARALFAIHAFVAVWRVVTIKNGDVYYWLLTSTIGLLVFEGLLSICKRNGREMKWFCPSVFLYLSCIIPPTWIMELDLADSRREIRMNGNNSFVFRREKLSQIPGLQIEIDLELSSELWAKILEQFLLVNLILGRWLLPKGDLTRSQLSQLLLVYIGMAADIVELFEAFKEDAVVDNLELTYTVLAMWSWSLMQFPLVLTATKARKTRLGMDSVSKDYCEPNEGRTCWCAIKAFCILDTWAIMTTIIFQDGPFLCLRLLLILKYNVISYLNVFFTCKNSLVLLLQVYRMTVLNCETKKKKPNDSKRKSASTDVESNPLKSSKLDYNSDNIGLDCKYEDEGGYFPGYEPKMPSRYFSSDEDEKSDPEYWRQEAESSVKRQRHKLKYREKSNKNALLQNSDMFSDETRDSVFLAYSQNKGSPWTDVCLNLVSSKSSQKGTSKNHRKSIPYEKLEEKNNISKVNEQTSGIGKMRNEARKSRTRKCTANAKKEDIMAKAFGSEDLSS